MLALRIRSFDSSVISSFRDLEERPENPRTVDQNQDTIPTPPEKEYVPILSRDSKKKTARVTPLPQKKTIITVIRSPHVDKRGREQIESRRYGRLVTYACNAVQDGVDIERIILEMPAGIGVTLKLK